MSSVSVALWPLLCLSIMIWSLSLSLSLFLFFCDYALRHFHILYAPSCPFCPCFLRASLLFLRFSFNSLPLFSLFSFSSVSSILSFSFFFLTPSFSFPVRLCCVLLLFITGPLFLRISIGVCTLSIFSRQPPPPFLPGPLPQPRARHSTGAAWRPAAATATSACGTPARAGACASSAASTGRG